MIQINTEFDREAYFRNVWQNRGHSEHIPSKKMEVPDPAVTLEISDESMRKIQSGECRKEFKEEEIRRYNPFETNELEDELYRSMGRRSSEILKDKDHNYDAPDLMKAMMDAYAQEYDRILKDHENGDRRVNYEISGEWDITLDEELAKLDEAFQRRLDNLDSFIGVKQWNEKVKLAPVDHQLLKRLYEKQGIPYESKQQESKTINPENMDALDRSYNESAVSIMKEAQRIFLERHGSGVRLGEKASGIVSALLSADADFMRKTHGLFG